VSSYFILDVNAETRWHLARAVTTYIARNGTKNVPEGLLELDAMFLSSHEDAQGRTGSDHSQRPLDRAMLLDVNEAAGRLSVSPTTVKKLTATGELPSRKIAGRRLYGLEDLETLIANSAEERHA